MPKYLILFALLALFITASLCSPRSEETKKQTTLVGYLSDCHAVKAWKA
jgi:hypothetical protein